MNNCKALVPVAQPVVQEASPMNAMSSKPQDEDAQNSSIYEEGMEMLVGSLVIYIFAELRDMIREGKLTSSTLTLDDLEPPLTAQRTIEIIQSNKEALAERAIDHEYLESRLEALRNVSGKDNVEPNSDSSFSGIPFLRFLFGTDQSVEVSGTLDTGVVLATFMDNNSKEEMVHGVVVNTFKRRITVIFRGSVTPKDFLQDAKCAQHKIKNPVVEVMDNPTEEEMPPTLNLHTGFHEYMFHKHESGKTRLELILDDVKEQLRKHEGYSLYVTGHSLGGALSTIFGFFAACDAELMGLLCRQCVVVYSVASPYCGNWKFRHAFQELERRKRLQHLRIANLEDMVTLMPFAVPKPAFLSPALSLVTGAGNLYKHVGIKLQLNSYAKDKSKYEHKLVYPKEHQCEDDHEYVKELQDAIDSGKSFVKALFHLCTNDFDTIEMFHSCDEYETRLKSCQEALKGVTLQDLYNDPAVIGNLFDSDYKPALLGNSGMTRAVRSWTAWTSTFKSKTNEGSKKQEDDEEMTLTQAALAS